MRELIERKLAEAMVVKKSSAEDLDRGNKMLRKVTMDFAFTSAPKGSPSVFQVYGQAKYSSDSVDKMKKAAKKAGFIIKGTKEADGDFNRVYVDLAVASGVTEGVYYRAANGAAGDLLQVKRNLEYLKSAVDAGNDLDMALLDRVIKTLQKVKKQAKKGMSEGVLGGGVSVAQVTKILGKIIGRDQFGKISKKGKEVLVHTSLDAEMDGKNQFDRFVDAVQKLYSDAIVGYQSSGKVWTINMP